MFYIVAAVQVFADCGPPTVISDTTNNSTGSVSSPNGAFLYYRCDIGFRESGTSNIYRCNGTHWLGDYYCEKITCAYIVPPSNGRVTNDPTYDIGTQMKFECYDGYNMAGPRTLLCMADGYWDPDSPPVCNAVNCGDFGHVSNGRVYKLAGDGEQNDYGRVIKIECDEYYMLTGSSHVSCGADGTWEERPTCARAVCPSHPGIANSTCIDYVDLPSSGLFVDLFCKEDGDISVTVIGDGDAYCNDGVWDDPNIACHCDCRVEVNSDLVEIYNLNNKGFVPHGATLDWDCKQGGSKNTSGALVCRDRVIATPVCMEVTSTTSSTTPSTTTAAATNPEPSTTTASGAHAQTSSSITSSMSTTSSSSPSSTRMSSALKQSNNGISSMCVLHFATLVSASISAWMLASSYNFILH